MWRGGAPRAHAPLVIIKVHGAVASTRSSAAEVTVDLKRRQLRQQRRGRRRQRYSSGAAGGGGTSHSGGGHPSWSAGVVLAGAHQRLKRLGVVGERPKSVERAGQQSGRRSRTPATTAAEAAEQAAALVPADVVDRVAIALANSSDPSSVVVHQEGGPSAAQIGLGVHVAPGGLRINSSYWIVFNSCCSQLVASGFSFNVETASGVDHFSASATAQQHQQQSDPTQPEEEEEEEEEEDEEETHECSGHRQQHQQQQHHRDYSDQESIAVDDFVSQHSTTSPAPCYWDFSQQDLAGLHSQLADGQGSRNDEEVEELISSFCNSSSHSTTATSSRCHSSNSNNNNNNNNNSSRSCSSGGSLRSPPCPSTTPPPLPALFSFATTHLPPHMRRCRDSDSDSPSSVNHHTNIAPAAAAQPPPPLTTTTTTPPPPTTRSGNIAPVLTASRTGVTPGAGAAWYAADTGTHTHTHLHSLLHHLNTHTSCSSSSLFFLTNFFYFLLLFFPLIVSIEFFWQLESKWRNGVTRWHNVVSSGLISRCDVPPFATILLVLLLYM